MRALFCGDRNWSDEQAIKNVMGILNANFPDLIVIEGEAEGADKLSAVIARVDYKLQVKPFPAEWSVYGRAAGPKRNAEMLKKGKPDAVFAFHYDLSKSKGTKNMVEQAMRAGVPVWVCTEGNDKLGALILQLKAKLP